MPPKTYSVTKQANHLSELKEVLLQIARADIQTDKGIIPVNVLMDSGSQLSFISSSLASQLPKAQGFVDLTINALQSSVAQMYPQHQLTINCQDGTSINIDGVEIQNILPPLDTSAWHQGAELFPSKDLSVYTQDKVVIDLLIGGDQLHHFMTSEPPERRESLISFETVLGPTLLGPLPSSSMKKKVSAASLVEATPPKEQLGCFSTTTHEKQIDEAMNQFLQNISEEEKESKREETQEILDRFYSEIKFANNVYSVPLLWKREHPPLPTNQHLATTWLLSLKKKLLKDGLYHAYNSDVERQVAEDSIEFVGKLSSENTSPGHHFLPHFPVLRPNHPTTPLRIVFAANCGKVSLNDCLDEGPSLINDLTSLLRRFRTGRVGFSGDLRKAFNSLEIKEEDRPKLQFLWFDEHGDIVVFRHKRVQFGPTCSPFLLFATLNYHLLHADNAVALQLISEFYSDNLVGSTDHELTCLNHLTQAIDILKKGNFNLRNCRTNSKTINEKLKTMGKLDDSNILKILGLQWNTDSDTLSFSKINPISSPLTKRKLLAFTASLFDPMGLLIYASAPCMAFVTKLWALNYEWDEELTPELAEEWAPLQDKAIDASSTIIHRHHPLDPARAIKVCVFTDSSDLSAAAVASSRGRKTQDLQPDKNERCHHTEKRTSWCSTRCQIGRKIDEELRKCVPQDGIPPVLRLNN